MGLHAAIIRHDNLVSSLCDPPFEKSWLRPCTQFQTKIYGQSLYPFSDQNVSKTPTLWSGTYLPYMAYITVHLPLPPLLVVSHLSSFSESCFGSSGNSSLRSRRLEVAGERENTRARGRHATCAHYFQAPATQARVTRFPLNACDNWMF